MDVERNWARVKAHRGKLNNQEIQGLASVLFLGQEDWLSRKLEQREDESLAIEFLAYLGQNGSEKATRILLRQLENREEMLQVAAVEGLKLCPIEFVLEPLASMMLRQNQNAIKAGEVLLHFGEIGVDVLWQLWFADGCSSSLRAQILRLLTEAADRRAEGLAFLAFLSEDEELLREALVAAERLGARELWGNVADCLGNASWKLRGRAAKLLGEWKVTEALAYLRDMGMDPDPWVEDERLKAIGVLE